MMGSTCDIYAQILFSRGNGNFPVQHLIIQFGIEIFLFALEGGSWLSIYYQLHNAGRCFSATSLHIYTNL